MPAQQVALGAVGGDAEDVERGVGVAALHRELRGPPLGEAEQPAAELRLVVVRVHPEVGLELAGAELVAGVGVAHEAGGTLRHPGVARGVEALHGPVVLEVVDGAVGLADLGDVAGAEQVDDLGEVAARRGADAARASLMSSPAAVPG